MKNKRKRWVVLLCLIAVIFIASGYYVYSTYFGKQNNTIDEIEYEEEIQLGDSGACSNSARHSYDKSCKNVNCSKKNNSSACYSTHGCCNWTACRISNCKSYTVKNGQCLCSECAKNFQKVANGKRCQAKQTSSTCCAKNSSGDYVTLNSSASCSNAFIDNRYVHSGACRVCSSITIQIPSKASAVPGITITGPSTETLEEGVKCTWDVTANGKTQTLKCGYGRGCSVQFSGFAACTKVNVSVSGPTSNSGTVSIETKFSEETENKEIKSSETVPTTPEEADLAGKSYYADDTDSCVQNANGTQNCQVYVRSNCGTRYNYCCVNNGSLLTSSDAIYKSGSPSKTCPTNYTLLENVKKEDCVIKNDLGSCDTTTVSSPKKKLEANVCEDTVNMSVDENKQCTNVVNNEKNSFYEISCIKSVTTNFDYGNDGVKNTARKLNKGEGFAFGVNIGTTVYCKYTFYDTVWKTAYNNVIKRIRDINSNLVQYVEKNNKDGWKNYIEKNILNKNGIYSASELYRLWDIVVQLRGVVDAYNKYTPSDDYKEQGRITVKTKENGNEVTNKHELLQIINDVGTTKKINVSLKKLNVPLVTNPSSYILTSSSPRSITLIPKRVCINKTTGEVKTVDESNRCPANTVDGGNKIYISYNTDVTDDKKYTISVEVDGLGTNNSEVRDDRCDLGVSENTYIYRPIDVGNPFINSSWERGKNWVNDKFDFTKVIHATTWSESAYKKIELTANDIEAIKKSNKDNRENSPYLGLCDKQNAAVQDEITRKLCNAIK